MFVEYQPAQNLWDEFNRIPSGLDLVLFWSHTEKGWGRIMAWNPVARIDLYLNDDLASVQAFLDQNRGKFIAGYMTYDAGTVQLNVSPPIQKTNPIPAISFRAYDQYKAYDYGNSDLPVTKIIPPKFHLTLQKANYKKQIERILRHIRSGDIYQINYTHQMVGNTRASARELYPYFIKRNQVEFAAYLEWNGIGIHSLSPERFFNIENRIIQTEPVKGTRPLGKSPEEINKNIKELLDSRKESAELNMIIDLMRNDLGKICETGSIEVLESRSVKTLSEVIHTYGIVRGKLKPELGILDVLLSLSPGGSISGCPKKRAVEIINELEGCNRGIYTGGIGYILPNGNADFNISIRTVIQTGDQLTLGVGGGITIESNPEAEFNETLAKAQSFQP